MTNIFEIISTFQNEGFNIDAVIYSGRVFISYGGNNYDITTASLCDQLHLIIRLLNT